MFCEICGSEMEDASYLEKQGYPKNLWICTEMKCDNFGELIIRVR